MVVLLAVAATVAGCAPYPLQGQSPKIATQTIEVPTGEALVLPEPGGPRVITVLETRYLNALEQEIILATNSVAPGQNAFHVTFFGPVDGRTGRENILSYDRLDEDELDRQMEQALPNVYMRRSNYFVQNRYGPFGYAIGRGGSNDMCIYAWQRIQSQVPVNVLGRDRGVLSLRYRFCQTGATEQTLLRGMYRYSINGYFLPRSWQPYGRPMGEPDGIGRIGGPLAFPTGVEGDATVLDGALGPEPAPRAAPVRRVRHESRGDASPALVEPTGPVKPSEPLEGYPMVPAPNQVVPQNSAIQTPAGAASPASGASSPASATSSAPAAIRKVGPGTSNSSAMPGADAN
ncbi:cellulose biosynthesis protein BcsN [Ancylobacter lacus]|uniref:cellulose biosynthesis protein BcsN n=1 Tax=Ancylobacter lacus TaxID=2579970 RepID=UPI001BD0378A|nr:cellulose biosynthesis protein BcsN [Ancylobacter lacus]MBS7538381.1 cellulose biosynthesis protein BcsN [Ancylobacter lacus]